MNPIVIIVIIIIFLFVPISAYATYAYDEDYSNDPEYEGKTPLRFYQIFASEDTWYAGACDDAKNSFLRSKTIQVLKMYDYLPITSKMECVKVTGQVEMNRDKWTTDSSYGLTLQQTLDRAKKWDYDLLIIVLDNSFSWQYLEESKHVKGWSETGTNGHIVYDAKTIVTRTDNDGAEQFESARTMAHEIAHFAVFQKYGYDALASGTSEPIARKAVHDIQMFIDNCRNIQNCKHLWVPLKTHSGISVEVMSPSYVMEYAESMKQKVTTPTPKYSNQDNGNPDTINGLIVEYGNIKNSIMEQRSAKITKYQQLHFDSPLAKAKLGYVLIELKQINFETEDYSVQVLVDNWMDGLYSVGESGMREEIASINEKFNELRNLDSEIIKAKNIENDYKNKLLGEKEQKQNEVREKQIEAEIEAIEIAKNRIEQDSQREEEKEHRKQNLISENELKWFLSKSENIEKRITDVEYKFKQSFESLRQSEKDFIGDIPKKHIEKGWDIRLKLLKEFPELQGLGREIIQDIDNLEREQNNGNVHFVSVSEIKRDVGIFEPRADKMSFDMKYVSQEIDYAKKAYEKLNPKTCFLFWCW